MSMYEDGKPPSVSAVAALQQELATAKRNEHNSEVAYKAAIERQEELRASLTAAEQRNAELVGLLQSVRPLHGYSKDLIDRVDAALNPTTEGAEE